MSPTQIPQRSTSASAPSRLTICAFAHQTATARTTSGTKRALSSRSRRHISTATTTTLRRRPHFYFIHRHTRASSTRGIIFCQKPLRFIFAENCRFFLQSRTSLIRKSNNKRVRIEKCKLCIHIYAKVPLSYLVCGKRVESSRKRHENIRPLFIEMENSDDCANFFANMKKV